MRTKASQGLVVSVKVVVSLLMGFELLACKPDSTGASLQYANQPKQGQVPIYRLAVHPLHNPEKLTAAYQPLVDHLNSQLQGVKLELESSSD